MLSGIEAYEEQKLEFLYRIFQVIDSLRTRDGLQNGLF